MDFKEQALEVMKKHSKAMLVELVMGGVADQALEAAAKAIPGQIDDAIIAMLKEPLKAELVKLVEGL